MIRVFFLLTVFRDSSHKMTCHYAPTPSNFDVSRQVSALNISTISSDYTGTKCMDDYEIVNQKDKLSSDLGKGAFGQVKLVRDRSDPTQLYAMKIVSI